MSSESGLAIEVLPVLLPEPVPEQAPAATGAAVPTAQTSAEELEAMKTRLAQMEEETARLRAYQAQMEQEAAAKFPTDQEKLEADLRSVYVGSVDYGATPEELQQHFKEAGTVNRVTILVDKQLGLPKGFAYVEFADAELAERAVEMLNESEFRDRMLRVTPKRTNTPGMGFRGRGRGRGRGMRGGRGRGRGMRGRGGFVPY